MNNSNSNSNNNNSNNNRSALFEIKVALLGPVSSGKTTVLNALLGDLYGPVHDSPATATATGTGDDAVHYYRLIPPGTAQSQTQTLTQTQIQTDGIPPNDSLEESKSEASYSYSYTNSYYPRSNISSVAATTAEQQRLQQNILLQAANVNNVNNNGNVEEVFHNIPLQEDLFDMRPDTQLVFVDIPGLDCAATVDQDYSDNDYNYSECYSCPYTNYVQEHWNSFDCIIIVLDVTTATASQNELLLQFIRKNLDQQQQQQQHALPILCLWNKLDDPFDPVHLDAIRQTQQLVNVILNPEPNTSNCNAIHQAQRSDNKRTIPFRMVCNSEPYTFGPPMTDEKIIQLATTTRPSSSTSYKPQEDTSDDVSDQQDFVVKEPGEGYVVVAKKQEQDAPFITPTQHYNTDAEENESIKPTAALSFLPLSAKIALIYKRVAHMSLEDFIPWMEHDFMVERLGRELIGLRRWNRLTTRQEQMEETYHALRNDDGDNDNDNTNNNKYREEYNRALDSCGYTAFETALAELVGNRHGAQTAILETQMEYSLQALLAVHNNNQNNYMNNMYGAPSSTLQHQQQQQQQLLAPQMYSVYTKFQVLYGATDASITTTTTLPNQLQSAFWAAYETLETSALQAVLEGGPTQVGALAEPLEQLISFYSVSKLLQWQDGKKVVTRKMKQLVLQYFQLLLEQEAVYNSSAWGAYFQSTRKRREDPAMLDTSSNPWSCLSPKDWIQIWSSILLLSYDRSFCQTFGREKLLFEELLEKARSSWKKCSSLTVRICPYCGQDLRPFQNEWRCEPCQFAFFTCFPSTLCNACQKYCFDDCDDEADYDDAEPHVCPMNGYTYSSQQKLHFWMRTFYNRSQELLPVYPAVYNHVVQTGNIPESLSDPNHLGHVVFQYCSLREMVDNE